MYKIIGYFFLVFFVAFNTYAIDRRDSITSQTNIVLKTKTGDIFGTLLVADSSKKTPVALIIAGSGPTDRDGNNPRMKNNSLKMLAYALAQKGISSLRFDKRAIGESRHAGTNEADLRFDDYVHDAEAWIAQLKQDKRFNTIIVIGHSEGSLIGIIAAQHADKFISIAGAGRKASQILREQLSAQPDTIKQMIYPIIDSLDQGKTAAHVAPMLYTLFRPQIQPYLISWFKYDPLVELRKLNIPVLLLQGTADIQVKVDDAKNLSNAYDKAKLVIIENMNHVLKIVNGSTSENIASYNNPMLAISMELTDQIINFIKK